MTAFASRAPGHSRRPSAEPWVLRWARWYTRDLDQQVRQDRLDELTSDLWEQRSAARRRGASGVGAAMIGRAARGAPGDLAWRHDELRADPALRGIVRGWTRSGLLAATYLIAAMTLIFAALVWARVLSAAAHHLYLPSATTLTSLGVAVGA
ncbi:hypothetical protein GCM10009840_20930 [Pseudolysinimonas kribbensis]|uniref:DUF2868 domain-containing protein n=1 Tax=Pseudolysinimonas kribbensis TaxID=433641 RepID=A0ABQ6K3H0_9MICO|nr:hypothetical protein [Pseudolysinimonas kribbensis]GMA93306.1 hypothetical protein GCM10025881_01300 [Pseudolysinimonas kribbensis]